MLDTVKACGGDLLVHRVRVTSGVLSVGQTVRADVTRQTRRRVRANHTATHLLQRALKIVLGEDTAQQGSQVTPDALRFDFNAPQVRSEFIDVGLGFGLES